MLYRAGLVYLTAVLWAAPPALAWQEAPLCAMDGHFPRNGKKELASPHNTCGDGSEERLPTIPWTTPPSVAEARAAFAEAARLRASDRPIDALLHLRVVEAAFPSLADRIALLRGDLLLASHQPDTACEAYVVAADSLERNVAARARVGYVRCGLAMDADDASLRLTRLLQDYPKYPDREGLRLMLAHHLERDGDLAGAIDLYRGIDVRSPGSQAARNARSALCALSALGVDVGALSPAEETLRVERLVRSGPFPQARMTLNELLARPDIPDPERSRLYLMAARLARTEGRWAAAAEAVRQARALGMSVAASERYMPPSAALRLNPERAAAQGQVDQRIQELLGSTTIEQASNAQLQNVLEMAIQYGLKAEATAAVRAIAARRSYYPAARFDAAVSASGVADDGAIAALLSTIVDLRRYQVSGRYHYARALERMGNLDRAVEHYQKVLALDDRHAPYYSLWAEQRLWAIRSHRQLGCMQADVYAAEGIARPVQGPPLCDPEKAPEAQAGSAPGSLALVDAFWGGLNPEGQVSSGPQLRRRVLKLLQPLARSLGDVYPWLARARDLILLDQYESAADELNAAYLAYRDARGSPRLRSGLHAIFSGSVPPRQSGSAATRRARARLSDQQKRKLAQVAALLGDHGTAVRLAGEEIDERPRAYAPLVYAAAERHGVDPDLLFAVIRVESIYNRRAISHVGAIGLTQIMPRTGRLIADSLRVHDFQPSDLLDPKTNLNFSAWYLSSLIRRFDGRLPLAIASYNGGPHNVRAWLRAAPRTMPLDAFLELIPFSETHRYVRRVLTHYAAYRAKRFLPMPRLGVRLPELGPDTMAF